MPIIETERLILREIVPSDAADLFELDSDPEVHRYIENKPVKAIDEIYPVIEMLRKQYEDYGIARWAVVDKLSKECLGCCGLKYFIGPLNGHQNFVELGYRFKRKHWHKGYATESAKAIMEYAQEQLHLTKIYAITDPENEYSKKLLYNLGFKLINRFDYDGALTDWFAFEK
ncbi:GNAT family N-acetyltransferase [Sphingobacterium sp. HJSM2_6]|uniref:GNAT family N-acetyltransferase n=1 Tax=Sphingobacterium sp. HJSM2_6 TaxID=3366264 RepID=UPI003BD728D7